MSINYNSVISSGSQGVFLRLLIIWKGSLYKLVMIDLCIYVALYSSLSILYRFVLTNSQQTSFEEIVKYCDGIKNNIPLSFLLGFFVAGVISRWWKLYYCIPWLNKVAFVASSYIIGNGSENSRELRLTLMRYANLAWVLGMRQISDQIKNRFTIPNNEPSTTRNILESLNRDPKVQKTYKILVTEHEIQAFEKIAAHRERDHQVGQYRASSNMPSGDVNEPEYWVPLQWAVRLLQKAFVHGYMSDPRTMASVIDEMNRLRDDIHELLLGSCILIPLVYTQVVIIAVFSYCLCNLFAAQFVDPDKKIPGHEVDLYFPLFNVFQFLFIMGWLKVAMCVMNPFGDDDEDFETSAMLDYNLNITLRSAGASDEFYPPLLGPPGVKYKCGDHVTEDNLKEFQAYEKDTIHCSPTIMEMSTISNESEVKPQKQQYIDTERNGSEPQPLLMKLNEMELANDVKNTYWSTASSYGQGRTSFL